VAGALKLREGGIACAGAENVWCVAGAGAVWAGGMNAREGFTAGELGNERGGGLYTRAGDPPNV
jgi:hypothetical protein